MNAAAVPLAEVTATAIRVLCKEIGVVNTARFLNQFSTGLGNYTEERDQIIGAATVDDLVAEVQQRRVVKAKPQKPARKQTRPGTP